MHAFDAPDRARNPHAHCLRAACDLPFAARAAR